jgi:spore coat polysaccharide biosynthesis protein SpsF
LLTAPKNILIVVQARTGSTRLPGKVLMDICGKSLLERQMERVMASKLAFKSVVATTTDASDDAVEQLCQKAGIECFRGHPTDLLDRHYQAGVAFGADAVVKIPSDCPLIDPRIIDKVLQVFKENWGKVDFVSNLHPPTYPDGNDVEVMPMSVLKTAWEEAKGEHEREHTTPFIWDNPQRFKILNVEWESGLDYSMSHRWTIDYPEDYEFIKAVYEELLPKNPFFSLEDILELLKNRPDICAINEHYCGVNWYRNHLDVLKTVGAENTKII